MRDELTAVLIFAVMLGGFALNSCVVDDCADTVNECISEFESAVNSADADMIEKSTDKLIKTWNRKMKNIAYSCQHSQIDAAEKQILSAAYYAEHNELEKALYEIGFARHFLDDLSKKENFRLDNIF